MTPLRWPKVFAISLIAAIAGIASLTHHVSRTRAESMQVFATHQPVPIAFDLSDSYARDSFEQLPGTLAVFHTTSLAKTCKPLFTQEAYRVVYTQAFSPTAILVEISGRQSGTVITTTYPPPPPPEPSRKSDRKTLAPERDLVSRTDFVASVAQVEAIRQQSDRLFLTHAPSSSNTEGYDGSTLDVEICRGDRYAYFHRWTPDPNAIDSVELVRLANLLLTAAKQEPFSN